MGREAATFSASFPGDLTAHRRSRSPGDSIPRVFPDPGLFSPRNAGPLRLRRIKHLPSLSKRRNDELEARLSEARRRLLPKTRPEEARMAGTAVKAAFKIVCDVRELLD